MSIDRRRFEAINREGIVQISWDVRAVVPWGKRTLCVTNSPSSRVVRVVLTNCGNIEITKGSLHGSKITISSRDVFGSTRHNRLPTWEVLVTMTQLKALTEIRRRSPNLGL